MTLQAELTYVQPGSALELSEALAGNPDSRLLGGGTDLIVNLRRGIGPQPSALIDVNRVSELQGIEVHNERLRIGAATKVATMASDPRLLLDYPMLAAAAASIAGPTHRNMGTLGGNLCLDTRCVYYNQSEWWRNTNDYCLKYAGTKCHVAPKSKVCYATFHGDLPPALLVLDARVELNLAGCVREARIADLYTGDGKDYLSLEPGEFVSAVYLPRSDANQRTGYDKVRVRQSIDYPLAGVAVALRREAAALVELRVAFTGTNSKPFLLTGLEALYGKPLDEEALAALEALSRRQVMAMRTTFTSGHYRRRAAVVLARRLAQRLFAEA